ncbi:hypothetical protein ACFLWU_06755 [Chloroflexota bacterium]
MTGYYGEQAVKGGTYLKHSTWEFESVAREGGILNGSKMTRYSRIPISAVMVAGPLMGLIYAIFLPTMFCLTFIFSLFHRAGQKIRGTG